MAKVLAKFRCGSVKTFGDSADTREFEFFAQYDESIPEDQRFHKYTPSGHLTMTVTNPDVQFEAGKSYYLTFEEV